MEALFMVLLHFRVSGREFKNGTLQHALCRPKQYSHLFSMYHLLLTIHKRRIQEPHSTLQCVDAILIPRTCFIVSSMLQSRKR